MAKILKQKAFLLSVGIALLVLIFNSCIHFDRFGRTKYQPYRIGAVEYVPLDSLCYKFDMVCKWDEDKGTATLKKDKKELLLFLETQSLVVAGESKRLLFPMIQKGDRLMLPREIEKLQWWSDAEQHSFSQRLFRESIDGKTVVVVDAGHGGHETGAVANGIQEKDITFRVAQTLQKDLEAAGIEVVMTRDLDEYLSLPDRTWIVNTIKPDLFISVHANAAPNTEASGLEIYHVPSKLNGNKALIHDSDKEDKDYRMKRNALLKNEKTVEEISPENRKRSAELADLVHREMIKSETLIKDRGIKQAEFFVTKWVDTPSVLVELGFVTNFVEGSRLMNPEYQESLASAISSAAQEYLRKNATHA